MSEFLWTPESQRALGHEKTLHFTFTQQLGRTIGPVRSDANSRAAGKIILVGEHAVVYGARAIAIPLLSKSMNLRIFTDRVATNTPKIKFQIGGKPVNDQLIAMVQEAFEVLGLAPFNVSIDGHSTLMLGAGVGSSASLCVSLLRGLCQICGITLTPARLSQLANRLERRFHGNPSGLDTSVVSLEQAILFERGRDAEALIVNRPRSSNLPWCFALLDTGVRSPTINMVRKAEPWFKEQGSPVISTFNDITTDAARALREGEAELLADAMAKCHDLLTEAGVVTEPVADVVANALRHGASAAKVTGAGGGGCVLALIPTNKCDKVIAALRQDMGSDRVHPIFIP
jgi:mevalonate kinase